MRILGFHIEGFSIFRDADVPELPGGLTLFLGPNESGKTTLMEFFRMVFFGPARKGSKNQYPPLRGGSHGGRVRVALKDGSMYTIERLGRKTAVIGEAGDIQRVEPSEKLMGGIDRGTFERIFAIGLDDLQGIAILSQENVRGRLFAAGAGLGTASVADAIGAIDRQMESLLKPRGQSQTIAVLLRQIRQADDRIRKLKEQASEYARLQRKREELSERTRRAEEEVRGLSAELMRLEQLERAIEPWAALQAATRRAAELESARRFPAGGMDRLQELGREISRLENELKEIDSEASPLRSEIEGLDIDYKLIEHDEAIAALLGEREKFASALDELAGAEREVVAAREQLSRKLSDLGANWSRNQLDSVDTSVEVRHQVQEYGRRIDDAETKLRSLKAQTEVVQRAVEAAKESLRQAQRSFEALPVPETTDDEALERRVKTLNKLGRLLVRRQLHAADLAGEKRAKEGIRWAIETLQRRRRPGAISRWLPAGAFALVAVFAVAAFLAGQRSSAAVLVAFGFGLSLALAFATRASGPDRLETDEVLREHEASDARLEAAKQDLESMDQAIEQLAGELGLDSRPRTEAVDEEIDRAERGRAKLVAWRDARARRDERKAALESEEAKARRCSEEIGEAEAALEKERRHWRSWLAERDFRSDVRPEAFEILLQAIESARAAAGILREKEERLDSLGRYVAATKDKTAALLRACGRDVPASIGAPEIDSLARAAGEERERLKRLQEASRRLEGLDQRKTRSRSALKEHLGRLEKLFETAGAAGEEDFRAMASRFEELQACLRRKEDAELELLTIAGSPEALDRLKRDLGGADRIALKSRQDRLRAELEELSGKVREGVEESGRLEEASRQLAQSEELGRLLLERNEAREKLGSEVRRWAVLAVARGMLVVTRDFYERLRQPEVVKHASKLLEQMTSGRYAMISSLSGAIQLEDRSMARKAEDAWSRGLAEQVYLAVRLGLAREFGRRSEPLPLILDDVLVNFDPRRQAAAARVLCEFAREQQILVFSCHPEMADMFREAASSAGMEGSVGCYRLDDGTISPAPLG